MKALIGANLIDGAGGPVVDDATVLINGDRIEAVGPRDDVNLPPNTDVVDVSWLTVLPGLIDCHDHLASRSYDLAARWGLSGHVCPVGHRRPFHDDPLLPSGVADGVDAVRARVREMVRVGADVIKFATTGGASSRQGHGPRDIAFGPDEVNALVEEARALGHKTMCHALSGPGLRMAVEAGAGSIEHGCDLAEEPDLLKMMADKGIFFVPTVEAYEFHSTVSAPHVRERAGALMQVHQESLQQALAAGVKVVAGTDAGGFVRGDNAHELQFLVERGMSPSQAIQAGSGWAAECVGLEKEIGTLEAGTLADLLVVDGDPLRDIGVLRDPGRFKLVMKGGEAFGTDCPRRHRGRWARRPWIHAQPCATQTAES